jgi:hypothetical protein
MNKMGNILSDSYDEALDNMQQRRITTQPTEDTPVVKTVTKTYTVTLPSGHVENVDEDWLKSMRKWLNNEFGDHTVVTPTPQNPFVYRGPMPWSEFPKFNVTSEFEDKE